MPGPDLWQVVDLAEGPGLELLVLFGSRARGESHPGSDWAFGYLATAELDPDALLARLVLLLDTDRIDLVNLERTNGLLRFRVASEGQTLFESRPGTFDDFWLGRRSLSGGTWGRSFRQATKTFSKDWKKP